MKANEINRLNTLMKNVETVKDTLADLLMPITAVTQKYHCTLQEACKIKLNAEEYLLKYGCLLLDTTIKATKQMTTITTTKTI